MVDSTQTSLIGELNDVFCQQQCFAYTSCGGGYATAPCQCAWKRRSPRYLDCKACYLICLRRMVTVKGRPVDNARQQYQDGLDLRDLRLAQKLTEDFPLFIPLRTTDFPGNGTVLPLRWAAADATYIKERILTGHAAAPRFSSPEAVKRFLRVADTCRLLAVLNAQDKVLERIWHWDDRVSKFQRLASYGFELSTGATFSVVERTLENTDVPRFHNLVMQRRHWRVLSELQQADLTGVPNMYWFDDREENRWVDWLVRNPQVRVVSREFTRTRYRPAFEARLTGLLRLLERTGRAYHIFLVGCGPATAGRALRRLAEYGHTGTVLTSDPIAQGRSGKRYNADLKAEPCPGRRRDELVLENIARFETALLNAVANTALAQKASRNLLRG